MLYQSPLLYSIAEDMNLNPESFSETFKDLHMILAYIHKISQEMVRTRIEKLNEKYTEFYR